MSVVEFLWSQHGSETMDMSLNRSASSSEHPWTDADANLHSVTDMDTPHLSRELHVRDECHRL